MALAANLRAVDLAAPGSAPRRRGRVPASEVMISTPTIREYILDPEKTPLMHTVIAEGVTQYGMQTFDQSVMWLLHEGMITEEEALRNCNNPNELSLKLKGISGTSDRTWQPSMRGAVATPAAVPASGPAARGGGGPARPDWMSAGQPRPEPP